MKSDEKIKEKVVDMIGDKEVEEKVNESRDMLLNYQDSMNPKEKVTKKEIRQLMKDEKNKKVDKKENFFIVLLKKFQFRKFRKHNKKLVGYNPAE